MGCCEAPLFYKKNDHICVCRDVPWRVLTGWIFGWGYDNWFLVGTMCTSSLHGILFHPLGGARRAGDFIPQFFVFVGTRRGTSLQGGFSDGIMILCFVGTFHETSLHGVFGRDDVHIVLTWDFVPTL